MNKIRNTAEVVIVYTGITLGSFGVATLFTIYNILTMGG